MAKFIAPFQHRFIDDWLIVWGREEGGEEGEGEGGRIVMT